MTGDCGCAPAGSCRGSSRELDRRAVSVPPRRVFSSDFGSKADRVVTVKQSLTCTEYWVLDRKDVHEPVDELLCSAKRKRFLFWVVGTVYHQVISGALFLMKCSSFSMS